MNANYIEMIKGILGEMDKKKMDPVGKADADIDNDGDVDSSDKYLHKRRKAISKSMKKEGDAKVTPCPSCEGSMDNHDPECPKAKSEGCGDYDKKSKKEEVEQVAEVSANHSVYGHKADGTKKVIGRSHGSDEKEAISNFHSSPNNGQFKNVYKGFSAKRDHVEYTKEEQDLDENFRTLATKGMGTETKKTINVGRDVDYYEPKNGDKRLGKITKVHATGYHVKDANDGKTHKFAFHDRTKAKKMLESNQPVVSEQWGFGEVIETTEEGLNVYFEHGVEFNVPASSLTFLEDKKHTKGATAPEGLLDKESPRSKKFVKDHQKSDKSVEDLETKGHVDATKAGRATTKQAPARPGEKRVGDIKIVNPVQGAVTQTTGKE